MVLPLVHLVMDLHPDPELLNSPWVRPLISQLEADQPYLQVTSLQLVTPTASARRRTNARQDQPDPRERRDSMDFPVFPVRMESPGRVLKTATTPRRRDASTAPTDPKDLQERRADPEPEACEDQRDLQECQAVMASQEAQESRDPRVSLEKTARPALPETREPMPRSPSDAEDHEDHQERVDRKAHRATLEPMDRSANQEPQGLKALPANRDQPALTEMRAVWELRAAQERMPSTARALSAIRRRLLQAIPLLVVLVEARVALAALTVAERSKPYGFS